MKPIVTLAFASLCATALFASCAKETLVEQGNLTPTEEGSRVIAVSFAPQTKTALGDDGLTPEFTGQDEWVKVSNSSMSENCKVTVSPSGRASITTSLNGALKAVYPANTAKMDGSRISGIDIPSCQDGTFASANICMAENITDAATFVNQAAILKFYVGEEIGVTFINVTSSEEIADGSKTITVAASGGKTLYDDMPSGQDRRICYVAVKSGANANTLTFTTATNTQGQQTKTSTVDATLAIGTMYNAFIPYYVEVGDQKWGYCNIGAFLPEEPGKYFAWGDTAGQIRMNSAWSNGGFHTAPTLVPADPGTLPLEYDAANANWGDDWRMPTMEEFTELCKQCFAEWTVDYNKTGATGMIVWEAKGDDVGWFKPSTSGKGRKIKNDGSGYNGAETHTFSNTYAIGADSHAFFPIAGIGINNAIDYTYYGYYWSSSIYTSSGTAYTFFVYNDDASPQYSNLRFRGLPVRPVYDCSIPDGALPGVFSVGPNEEDKVHFSKGNLYCDNSNSSAPIWGFEEKQYYFRTISGKGKCDASGYSINTGTLSNHLGLFGWSSENDDNYGMNLSDDYKDYSGEFKDWGENIGDGNNWRTMSIDEWIYLLKTRKASTINGVSNARYMFCRIKIDDSHSVPGMLVFSDDFSWPTGNAPSESAATTINGNYGSYTKYEIAEFESLESAGAVFLPEAGNRKSGTEIEEVDIYGGYRSSTAIDEHYARYLSFYRTVVDMTYMTDSRHFSRSVRLVTNVK